MIPMKYEASFSLIKQIKNVACYTFARRFAGILTYLKNKYALKTKLTKKLVAAAMYLSACMEAVKRHPVLRYSAGPSCSKLTMSLSYKSLKL